MNIAFVGRRARPAGRPPVVVSEKNKRPLRATDTSVAPPARPAAADDLYRLFQLALASTSVASVSRRLARRRHSGPFYLARSRRARAPRECVSSGAARPIRK
jgi:hypothetical protein